MRLSCNGCRVLRKGCTDACTIRPCLQWIKTPEAQANATVFLAKFYGRAGLLNLLAASPTADLRPAVFRSLLYEACGRVVNPVYGAVGLLWSGTWHMCQAAVEAVLKGAPIVVVQQEQLGQQEHAHMLTTMHQHPPNYDIRHVVKQVHAASPADAPHGHEGEGEAIQQSSSSSSPLTLHKVAKPGRTRFKRKRAASSPSSSCNTTTNNNNNKKATPPHTRVSSSHSNEKAASPELPPANNEHDEQHQHAADIPSSSQCHASSDDDDHRHQQHSLDNSTDAKAGSSHVTTVADDDGGEHDDQEQHQQLGLHLTLGFFESATAPPPVQTHHTPAAADHDDDEPGPGPGLLLGFRFL